MKPRNSLAVGVLLGIFLVLLVGAIAVDEGEVGRYVVSTAGLVPYPDGSEIQPINTFLVDTATGVTYQFVVGPDVWIEAQKAETVEEYEEYVRLWAKHRSKPQGESADEK